MVTINPNFDSVGQAFVVHFYQKFDTCDVAARALGLSDLYDSDNSYMTFEGTQLKGKEGILAKFTSLTFKSIQRAVTKVDCQPLLDGGVFVSVLGQLKTDDDPPQSYTHAFILRPTPNGSFFIANEIFRLVLHNN